MTDSASSPMLCTQNCALSVANCRQLHCYIVKLSITKLSIAKIELLVLRIGVECEHSSERFV